MSGNDPMVMELNFAIDRWLEAKDRRNLALLANKSGVAYSTLRRLRGGDAKANVTNVLAITEVVMLTQERVNFFKEFFPSIGRIMESAFPEENEIQALSDRVKKFLHKEPHNKIFNMAATSAGITESDIKRHLGELGVEALNELLEDEVLHAKEGRIKFTRDHWTLANFDDVLNQVKRHNEYFDKSLIGTDYACLINNTGSLKASQLPKVKRLIEKFAADLAQLKNDPSAEGPVSFYCNVAYSLFDKNQLEQDCTLSEKQ